MSDFDEMPGSFSIKEREFEKIRALIYGQAGISLSTGKKTLVVSRLSKRLRAFGLTSFTEYLHLLESGEYLEEMRNMVDLLTTNETYFFREHQHFDFLVDVVKQRPVQYSTPFRVWSAASSTGEEAYTIAMFLEDVLAGGAYQVFGTDISSRVIEAAERGHYKMERVRDLPERLLHKYCLQGTGRQAGTVLVGEAIKKHVKFQHMNLHEEWPGVGTFDVIFLRNVMIYFDYETKKKLVSRLIRHLQPDGYLIIGHSETLNGFSSGLRSVSPSIYQRCD